MPHVDIELEDNKQFISNIPRNVDLGMINNNLFIQRLNGVKGTRNDMCYISPLFSERYTYGIPIK